VIIFQNNKPGWYGIKFQAAFQAFALCSRCGLHLGWKYSGKFSFYGLIKARLIKGAALFN